MDFRCNGPELVTVDFSCSCFAVELCGNIVELVCKVMVVAVIDLDFCCLTVSTGAVDLCCNAVELGTAEPSILDFCGHTVVANIGTMLVVLVTGAVEVVVVEVVVHGVMKETWLR